jgi:hypothetical protein
MRVVAIFNKWWECDPALGALWNPTARPSGLPAPTLLAGFRPRPDPKHLPPEDLAPRARAVFRLNSLGVEVWCLSDVLEHFPDENRYQSSTSVKAANIAKIFDGPSPDLVIALGTAGYPQVQTQNGSVTVGTKIFIHDPSSTTPNPDSDWKAGPFDRVLDSPLSQSRFASLSKLSSCAVRFLPPPLNAAANPQVLSDYNSVAVSSVNVTDYAKYAQADAETLTAFSQANTPLRVVSVETTHGLIRAQSNAPFLFISGITDRVGYFNSEVQPRPYAQNTAAAHNTGVVLGELILALHQVPP